MKSKLSAVTVFNLAILLGLMLTYSASLKGEGCKISIRHLTNINESCEFRGPSFHQDTKAVSEAAVGSGINSITDRIDRSVPQLMCKYHTPGVSISLIQNGEVTWCKSYGFANIENGIPMLSNTVFQAASISKPVTAWAIMKLVQEKKLSLDTPVEKYLTRWHFPQTGFNNEMVTVGRILSHTSGLSVGGYRGYPLIIRYRQLLNPFLEKTAVTTQKSRYKKNPVQNLTIQVEVIHFYHYSWRRSQV